MQNLPSEPSFGLQRNDDVEIQQPRELVRIADVSNSSLFYSGHGKNFWKPSRIKSFLFSILSNNSLILSFVKNQVKLLKITT